MAGRSEIKIKPWMLAKNTKEMISSYVQNIYKQMPMSFNKVLKSCKVATVRPENKGPLRTWKSQQKQLPANSITPRLAVAKKSNSKIKQHKDNVKFFKSNKGTHQLSTNSPSNSLTASKHLFKTPNYKIYKSLRYGSSCSSSSSSVFKRHDERRRRQSNVAQINYLIRSFHTSKFEPTYARFLMPARNQLLERNLGSITDALEFSNNMVKDLMAVDKSTRGKIAQQAKSIINLKPVTAQRHSLQHWNHPPSLSKYKIKIPKEGAIRSLKSLAQRNTSATVQTPESRDTARLKVGRASPLKHAKPVQELFTPQHDRPKTELHEKHRRNRMLKLGLIKPLTAAENLIEYEGKSLKATEPPAEETKAEARAEKSPTSVNHHKKVPKLANQMENNTLPTLLIKENSGLVVESLHSPKAKKATCKDATKPNLKTVKSSCIPLATKSNSTKTTPSKYTSFFGSSYSSMPISYSTISPIVAVRAQMPNNKADSGLYRYHRHDFFSTKKY